MSADGDFRSLGRRSARLSRGVGAGFHGYGRGGAVRRDGIVLVNPGSGGRGTGPGLGGSRWSTASARRGGDSGGPLVGLPLGLRPAAGALLLGVLGRGQGPLQVVAQVGCCRLDPGGRLACTACSTACRAQYNSALAGMSGSSAYCSARSAHTSASTASWWAACMAASRGAALPERLRHTAVMASSAAVTARMAACLATWMHVWGAGRIPDGGALVLGHGVVLVVKCLGGRGRGARPCPAVGCRLGRAERDGQCRRARRARPWPGVRTGREGRPRPGRSGRLRAGPR